MLLTIITKPAPILGEFKRIHTFTTPLAANMLNMQTRTDDKRWCSIWVLAGISP